MEILPVSGQSFDLSPIELRSGEHLGPNSVPATSAKSVSELLISSLAGGPVSRVPERLLGEFEGIEAFRFRALKEPFGDSEEHDLFFLTRRFSLSARRTQLSWSSLPRCSTPCASCVLFSSSSACGHVDRSSASIVEMLLASVSFEYYDYWYAGIILILSNTPIYVCLNFSWLMNTLF